MKKVLLAGVCVAVLTFGLPIRAHAVLPVIDTAALGAWATSLANDVKNYALQLKIWANTEFADEIQALQWLKQQSQYLLQVQQALNAAEYFANWVREPSVAGAMALLNVAGLGSVLPVNPMVMLGAINGLESMGSGGLSFSSLAGLMSSLNGFANAAWTTNHVYTPINSQTWSSQQIIAGANSIAGTQGTAMSAYQNLQNHLAGLPALRAHLLTSTSPKDVQDTAAQVALEQATTENQIGQIEAAKLMNDAARDAREQRDIEAVEQSVEQWLSASGTGFQS